MWCDALHFILTAPDSVLAQNASHNANCIQSQMSTPLAVIYSGAPTDHLKNSIIGKTCNYKVISGRPPSCLRQRHCLKCHHILCWIQGRLTLSKPSSFTILTNSACLSQGRNKRALFSAIPFTALSPSPSILSNKTPHKESATVITLHYHSSGHKYLIYG